ncbi:MAG: NIPSNAP family protein [Verrucomicrobiales bacterium]
MQRRILIFFFAIIGSGASWAQTLENSGSPHWIQSYDAGYVDKNGAWAGGSEIMHLAAHKGKLYASNGYWVDARWVIPPDGQKQSAQVLRLDSPADQWQVDLDMGHHNGLGLQFMKGNILKSVTFTRDGSGELLAEPQNLLVMAAGANFERGGAVSAWVRDDTDSSWHHTLVRHGSSASGIRWVPRDMEVYRDKVTGVEHLLMSLGNPGIISAVYDPSAPGNLRWNRHLEFPFLTEGSFKTRPLGMAQANGSLFFSEGDSIYQRIDGERPNYVEILDLYADTDTDVGGIRGLTKVANPNGEGDSLLFLWAPGEGSKSQIKRLDPDGEGGYTVHDEASIAALMSTALDVEISYTLGAHNMMYPITDPATGETVHLIGFQGNIRGKNHLRWKGSALYGGAMYAIRRPDQSYSVHEVNNAYRPGKKVLVSPRTFCPSPFGDGDLYIAGHDSSRKISDNMAWVFNAPLDVALGRRTAADAVPGRAPTLPEPRLLEGPIYELRIYAANEDRLVHLIKRFREHTDRLFKKHGIEAIGYWLPTDGPPKERRRFVYVLKHQSRYAAHQNWTHFSNDREWQKVIDRPEFKGLLAEKPTSIFMTATDYSTAAANAIPQPSGIYELRTYVTNPGKLENLNARFRNHTTRLFNKHGMKNIAYWTAFDSPDSNNTLIYLIHHANREQADANWNTFGSDPDWRDIARKSQIDGKFLARQPERIYLKAMEFSPMR